MNTPITLPWQEPLACLHMLEPHAYGALLYSGAAQAGQDSYSYLCVGASDICSGSDIATLRSCLSDDQPWHENVWVGWMGYGLKNQLEILPEDAPSPIQTEALHFFKPATLYRFDHQAKELLCIGEHVLEAHTDEGVYHPSKIASLHSNMSTAQYKAHVDQVLEEIRAGSCYQANLTRKFYGTLADTPDAAALFRRLCAASPAAYSAYIKAKDVHVLSSSPEMFLNISADGITTTRPIKGTIGRSDDAALDQTRKEQLQHSEKDRAENLMIVDLMRNDLSRVCTPGSVSVDQLFGITTHAHIHHMSSLIRGTLAPHTSALAAALACFPPGSMTGAPKIRAMEICSRLEQQARGVYSGALGWFGGDGSAHLSVVIRTILLRDKQFEFQVGGGIVADSTPQHELSETWHKAKGVCEALGIDLEAIQAL